MFIKFPILRRMIIKIMISLILIGVVNIAIVSCRPSNVQQDLVSPIDNEAYPIQTNNDTDTSLSGQISAYPPPALSAGTLLALNKPITSNDTDVSGVGPPGLPISIINITLMGEQLGAGVIGNDGTFSISVPLQPNIRIGINADIEAFGLTSSDVQSGDEAMNVPLVGYFFDTTLVLQD